MNWPVEVTYTDSVTFARELVASTLSCLFETVYSARPIEITSGTGVGVAVRVGVGGMMVAVAVAVAVATTAGVDVEVGVLEGGADAPVRL
jgi:glutamine phosphoribosylpyrophosphate amidotransferase